MRDNILRKRIASILFLSFCFLTSCSHPYRKWECSTVRADFPPVTYSTVYLNPCNGFNGLEAEFIFYGPYVQLYLNALSLQLPRSTTDENIVEVLISIGDNQYNFAAERLGGGQKLLMPEEAQNLIIAALLEGQEVIVSCGRYETTLIPCNFSTFFYKLCPN